MPHFWAASQSGSIPGLSGYRRLGPKIAADQPGTLYEGHDFAAIGAAVNQVLLMTYEWGYTYSQISYM